MNGGPPAGGGGTKPAGKAAGAAGPAEAGASSGAEAGAASEASAFGGASALQSKGTQRFRQATDRLQVSLRAGRLRGGRAMMQSGRSPRAGRL